MSTKSDANPACVFGSLPVLEAGTRELITAYPDELISEASHRCCKMMLDACRSLREKIREDSSDIWEGTA